MLVLSLVIGPPDGRCLVVSLRVRSGLIASHVWPSVRERNSTWAPTYRTPGVGGDSTVGDVRGKRYVSAPASFPSVMRWGLPRSIHIAWKSPCVPRWGRNVRPPSIDLSSETFSAQIASGFAGSTAMTLKYQARCVISWSSLTRVHVAPASSERNNPPSWASTWAYTRSGLDGATAMPMRPITPAGIPLFRVNSVQVSPPSVDLKSPEPLPPEEKSQGERCACHSAA